MQTVILRKKQRATQVLKFGNASTVKNEGIRLPTMAQVYIINVHKKFGNILTV